ncbi:GNAT family N-acetyltransferase [Sporosarcina highlanderae]|uniref:GNAT family N-acetyltransferase n=1 Tax=Sporosarcina highlanderae TaxID=3035916 RepID=A0ABT8JP51_9BACL|nr:GNAT family N-acetyltransferase [Sporosarcina highlanderae]MDN4606727.1 GNAT family N-acetyltransferase [Sporosarcina highlanderae]
MDLFNTIKKDREYWLVDQVKDESVPDQEYIEVFGSLLAEWRENQVAYLSLLMDATYEDWLLDQGFRKVSTIVEYTRELDESFAGEPGISVEALSDGGMSDSDFAELYEQCRSGSANKNKLFTIEQVMESLENELGLEWRASCFIFRKSGEPIGLSIPIIEQGTVDEGRLFYFGVMPEWRGKGYGAALHRISLQLLKGIGATTYVGSTDEANHRMIGIFMRNDCVLRNRKGIYRIDR